MLAGRGRVRAVKVFASEKVRGQQRACMCAWTCGVHGHMPRRNQAGWLILDDDVIIKLLCG